MSHVEVERRDTEAGRGTGRWMTVIYNNDVNTVDEVIAVLMAATGCDVQEAVIETWEAHTYGHASVHFGAYDVCDEAAGTISRIGVHAEVRKEWDE